MNAEERAGRVYETAKAMCRADEGPCARCVRLSAEDALLAAETETRERCARMLHGFADVLIRDMELERGYAFREAGHMVAAGPAAIRNLPPSSTPTTNTEAE